MLRPPNHASWRVVAADAFFIHFCRDPHRGCAGARQLVVGEMRFGASVLARENDA